MQVKKVWIIKNGGQFVGVDSASGGYPWDTDFWGCQKFSSLESAQKYQLTFKDHSSWAIYECDEVGTRYVPSAESLYEIELSALNKRFNK